MKCFTILTRLFRLAYCRWSAPRPAPRSGASEKFLCTVLASQSKQIKKALTPTCQANQCFASQKWVILTRKSLACFAAN